MTSSEAEVDVKQGLEPTTVQLEGFQGGQFDPDVKGACGTDAARCHRWGTMWLTGCGMRVWTLTAEQQQLLLKACTTQSTELLLSHGALPDCARGNADLSGEHGAVHVRLSMASPKDAVKDGRHPLRSLHEHVVESLVMGWRVLGEL